MKHNFSFNKKNIQLPIFRKPVELIHHDGLYSLLQRKIYNILLLKYLSADEHSKMISIDFKDLNNLIGYNSRDIKRVKEAIESLYSVQANYNLFKDNEIEIANELNNVAFLKHLEFGKGFFIYELSPTIKEIIKHSWKSILLDMRIINEFTSVYSLILYENCLKFLRKGKTYWIPLHYFRKLSGCIDIYPHFRDLNKRTIIQPIKELDEKAGLIIESAFHRNGRIVKEVQFSIKRKAYLRDEKAAYKTICNTESKRLKKKGGLAVYLESNKEYFSFFEKSPFLATIK